MDSASTHPKQDSDPRPGNDDDKTKADNAAYVTMEGLATIDVFVPSLLENPCASEKQGRQPYHAQWYHNGRVQWWTHECS